MDTPSLFDTHLHPSGLSTQDLESMRFFGVERALIFADGLPRANAKEILGALDDLLEVQLPRLTRAGIAPFAAVGVHPLSVPRRGLAEVLTKLPGYFKGGQVVALGETGFHHGNEAEDEAFQGQVALARELKLPLVVHTPFAKKAPLTRRLLTRLRASRIPPELVLVDHASASTVQLILACDHYVGLTLHPDNLRAERAVSLVRAWGSERLVLNSDSGARAGDMLAVPRAINLLAKASLSPRVRERLAHQNMNRFLRLAQ
jgi:predicted metal-dependent TIM-barrel fold hydrolase